jgi:dihydrodipicolinate synthase/N-acetylneuraminate lyase
MIYSNRVAYRVDVTIDIMVELADDKLFVAIKESSDDIRRSTEIFNTVRRPLRRLHRRRQPRLRGVGHRARSAGSPASSSPSPRRRSPSTSCMKQGRRDEALKIYRWFRPLLDLDVSTYLVQNIKLAEVLAIGTNERVRAPRKPLSGEVRARAEKIVRDAIATRPELPAY